MQRRLLLEPIRRHSVIARLKRTLGSEIDYQLEVIEGILVDLDRNPDPCNLSIWKTLDLF